MTVIVSGASRIMRPRVSPGYYEIATEPNRRRQCGVEMRRRHQAIWRTVLPFTLSSDVSPSPAPSSPFVVSFFIRLPLSRSPTRRPRHIAARYHACGVAAITVFAFARCAWKLLRPEQTLRPGGLREVATSKITPRLVLFARNLHRKRP